MPTPLDTPTPILPSSTDPSNPDSTSTAQDVVTNQNSKSDQNAEVDPKDQKRYQEFRQRIDICKLYRRKLIANWTINIDYRRGKPFASQTDEDQVAINLDWSLTKSKQAALFSQVPQVRIDHSPQSQQAGPWLKAFEQKLNDSLVSSGIEAAMDECLPDVINAAGIGAILVSYEAITQDKQVPKMDLGNLPPELHSQILQSGQFNGLPLEMETIPHIVDHRYCVQRISPADLLWPINFSGSDFDKAPWLGRSGRIPWAEAVQRFGLTDRDKDYVLGEDRPMLDRLSHDVERDKTDADEMVGFDEIWYWDYSYDTEAQSFNTIHHLIFVSGKDKPVLDEPWKGQDIQEGQDGTTHIIGVKRFPIRVLTLSYITDDTIPPSDSAIGRPQINELNKIRTQYVRQRERSLPVRWIDVNRIDPAVLQGLMRGTWQAMIPVQGDGSRSIGEVARANTPPENFNFDKIIKSDLDEVWTVAQNPDETGLGQSGGELKSPPSNTQTRITRERARVASFVVSIAEVLGSLMCLYEDPQSFGQGFTPEISTILNYSILADSTVVLDSFQRLARLNNFVNMYAKSGWISLQPVLQEIATLSGLDPNVVIQAPSPKPPVEPNISLRLTGVEDLMNPLVLAFLMNSGQAPNAQLIEAAKALIQQSVVPPQGPQDQPGQPGMPPGVPPTAGGPPPGTPPGPPGPQAGHPLPPPVQGPPHGTPPPRPAPPKAGEAHPNWQTLPKVNKRPGEEG